MLFPPPTPCPPDPSQGHRAHGQHLLSLPGPVLGGPRGSGFASFNSRAAFGRARRGAWPGKLKPRLQASLLVAVPSKAPTLILHFPLRGPPLPILSFRPPQNLGSPWMGSLLFLTWQRLRLHTLVSGARWSPSSLALPSS